MGDCIYEVVGSLFALAFASFFVLVCGPGTRIIERDGWFLYLFVIALKPVLYSMICWPILAIAVNWLLEAFVFPRGENVAV